MHSSLVSSHSSLASEPLEVPFFFVKPSKIHRISLYFFNAGLVSSLQLHTVTKAFAITLTTQMKFSTLFPEFDIFLSQAYKAILHGTPALHPSVK
jgi:hypothetical protein